MAKVLSRKVTIYIDGKEVENTIKSLEAEAAKLRAQQRNLVIGSEEYIETSRKLKEIKDVLAQQKNAVEGVADAYGEARKKAAEWSNILVGMKTLWQKGSDLFNWLKGFSDEAARMDDVYADVMKTTGLTRGEVLRLNEAFKGMDTRTAREELNRLAAEAGKLGIQGVERVAAFSEAADKIKVALGEDLGEDATTVIGKMAEVYTRSTAELAGAGDLGEKMLRIGSAINSLGAASSAAEPHMVDFLARLGGMASQAGLSAQQVLGYASALDQSGVSVEKSATAFQNFMSKMMQKPGEFAAIARQGVAEFRQLMETDMDAAIKAVLAGLNEEGGMTRLAPLFKDLQMAGSGVTTMLTTLKGSLDKVNEAQAIANSQMSSGASIEEEFAVKNNTMQARLDKAKDTFHDTAETLGNALYPAMISVTNAGSGLMSAASGLIGFLREYPAVLSPLVAMGGAWLALKLKTATATVAEKAAELVMLPVKRTRQALEQRQIMLEQKKLEAYHRNRQAEYLEMINKEKLILTDKAYAATVEGLARREQAEANIKAYSANATQHADAADKAHTATIRAKNAAMKATPWGLIIGLATTLATVIYKLATAESDLEKATKEANRQVFEEQGRLKVLRERMEGAAEGSEEYLNALGELRAMHPEIVSLYVDEKGHIEDLTGMYKALGEAAAASVYQRMYAEKASELQGELGEKLQDRMEWFGKKVNRVFSDLSEAEKLHIKQEINTILKEAADGETEFVDLTVRLRDLLLGSGLSISSTAYSVMTNELFKMRGEANLTTQALKELQTSLKATDPDPFGVQKKSLKELEAELAKVLEAMERGFSEGAEKDAARLKALRDQIAKLRKSSKEDETPGDDGGNYSGGETPAQRKAREKREREEKAWNSFSQNYEQVMAKITARTLTGVEKINAEVDASIMKMRQELENVDKTVHPEAAENLERLVVQAERWKAARIDEYLAKTQAEIDKLRKSTAKQGNGEQVDKAAKAVEELRQKISGIDDELIKLYADQAALFPMTDEASRRQLHDVNERIAAYRELRNVVAASVFASIDTSVKNPFEKAIDQDEDKGNFSFTKAREKAMAEVAKQVEEYTKKLDDAIAAEELMEQAARKSGNVDEAERHRKNAEALREQKAELDEVAKGEQTVKEKAEELAKSKAFRSTLQNWADAVDEFGNKALSVFSNINTLLKNIADSRLQQLEEERDAEIETLDEQLEQNLISQEDYESRKKELEDNYKDKADEAALEAWRREKLLGASEATIAAAVATMKIWAGEGSTAYKVAMSTLMAAEFAAQLLAIKNEPEPYARGGYVPRRTVYQAGEAGPEWVASNSLLTDPVAAPVIEQLEAYQRGNRRALADVPMAQLNMPVATRAARELGRRRSLSEGRLSEALPAINPNVSVTMPQNEEVVQLWRELAAYFKDPNNRRAVISRQTMTDFENNEQFLRSRARL
ncbi:MAG: phage tail tape measure protein [Bacteroidales bacterium]|nr:phage tail tape measure protein [Bacteroidales bacterium]